MLGVCLGDGQTEAGRVPSQGGRGDALLRGMPPPLPDLTCLVTRFDALKTEQLRLTQKKNVYDTFLAEDERLERNQGDVSSRNFAKFPHHIGRE